MNKIFIPLLIFIALFVAFPASASDFMLGCGSEKLSIGQELDLDIVFMSGEEPVNALEGSVVYPSDTLELVSVSDANSIIPLWIEKKSSPDRFSFAGTIPGGFGGLLIPNQQDPIYGPVISLRFRSLKSGEATVFLESGQALLNDGEGTADTLTANSCDYNISYEYIDEPQLDKKLDADRILPTNFQPSIFRDDDVEGGAWVIAFGTRDNESGVDHYEIREGIFGFGPAVSPYRLHDQNLTSDIVIKAVDRAGNERIVRVTATNEASWYEKIKIYVIILVVVILLIATAIKLRRKNGKSKK